MNSLIENGDIREMNCGENFAYILNDNSFFQETEFKFLQNQKNSCFVKCMKMMYNGSVEIYYMPKELKSFASRIPYLDAESFLTIVSNIFSSIKEVRDKGIFPITSVDISFDKIYVDLSTYNVSLIYVPVSRRIFTDDAAFENQLRLSLRKLIDDQPQLQAPKVLQLSQNLSYGANTLDDLSTFVISGKAPGQDHQQRRNYSTGYPAPYPAANSGTLRLISMDAPTRVEIAVTKDKFVIGKKAEKCDGVVTFNNAISRTHCMICREGGQYTITDVGSANGTFLNSKRLQKQRAYPLHDGDIVRLANSDFQVVNK